MQKILMTMLLLTFAVSASARQASLLVYQVWEAGIDPYISRILVTPDYLRLDEGNDSDGYTLFDRQQEIVYSVSMEDRSVLVIDHTDMVPGDNEGLILQQEVSEDPDAPTVAGKRPKQVKLLANGELCAELTVIDGIMEDAVAALGEMKIALARVQAATLDAIPLSMRTPCDLASNIYAPDRYLQFGLPLQERAPGRSQSLVDFSTDFDAEDALQALRPHHGCPALGGRSVFRRMRRAGLVALAPLGRRHPRTMRAVGGEHAEIGSD